jgi:hypothetical protein
VLARDILLSAPAITAILAGLFAPLALMFVLSFLDNAGRLSIENYQLLLEPFYLTGLMTTFKVAFAVAFICALLAYPLSFFLARLPPRPAAAAFLLVLLPFWTSVLLRTYAWLILLQRHGLVNAMLQKLGLIEAPLRLVNNMTGTIIGMVHVLLPSRPATPISNAWLRPSARPRPWHSGRSPYRRSGSRSWLERCLPSSPPSMNRLSPSSSPAARTRPFRKRCSSISTRNWTRRSPQSPGWSSD